MTKKNSVFSKSSIIKLHTSCVQSNSTTLRFHLYSYIFIVYPPKLDNYKSWDILPSWVNRNFPNPKKKTVSGGFILCMWYSMWLHACIQLYYLGLKKCSSYLEKEINYSSKITTHIIYIHDNSLQIPSCVKLDTCVTPFRYQNQTVDQIHSSLPWMTVCIPSDQITTVTSVKAFLTY